MTTALPTYKATLKGNYLQWESDVSADIDPQRTVAVYVTILDQPVEKAEQGQRMAQILENLAKINALQSIDDPVQWQKEIREDRPRPYEAEE